MAFEITREDNGIVAAVSGKLNAETAPILDAALVPALQNSPNIVFDLAGLEYISSAGLRTLLVTYKRTMKAGGSMRIRNVGENVMDVLEMSGFADIYDIE